MARRLPSQPPVLPGFTYLHVLGSGGFADVFLYEQNMPRRQVAVKVLLSEVVNDHVRQMFQAEANLMAQLSTHPSILTVYQASVSADGRPYLVMELCSSGLADRYRSNPLPVAEVLRVAVKIGSAIEAAHRAGVLHRDIKPSNILLTAYGHPVLSDFGIASTLVSSDTDEAVGMSIPWSAPEVLQGEHGGSIAAEVWSFAATVYSLLAGRSPFEIPGRENRSADLISRIGRARPQPIDRADVPVSLENAILRGLSRNPAHRPASVLELVHEFQAVETELGLPQTAVEVAMDDWALGSLADADDRTQMRPVSGASPAPAQGRRRRRSLAQGVPGDQPSMSGSSGSIAPKTTRMLAWTLVATALLVLGVAATAIAVLVRSGESIPTVSNIEAVQRSGDIVFTWPDPGLREGDAYQIDTSSGARSLQRSSTFVVAADPGSRVCVTVLVNRAGATGPSSNEKCVTASP